MKKRIINRKVYVITPEEQERTCFGCAFKDYFNEGRACSYIQPECEHGMIFKALETEETKKSNLKLFNLEEAKAGKPVCTRDGRKARIVCFDKNDSKSIVALIQSQYRSDIEVVMDYHNNGKVYEKDESSNDLMMLPEKKEGLVNVYRDCNGANITKDNNIYSSKDAAIASAQVVDSDKYIATTKIEWEE